MDVQEVEVTIGKDGKVQVHVRGVKGEACLDITRALESALGGQVELREMTPEAGEHGPPQGQPVRTAGITPAPALIDRAPETHRAEPRPAGIRP